MAIKAAAVAAGNEKEDRILSPSELTRCTRGELSALLNSIAQTLPALPEGSNEIRCAHANLQNIRRALAPKPAPGFGPR